MDVMKNLRDILYKSGLVEVTGGTDMVVTGIACDSRQVRPGMLFIAQTGLNTDGHSYIGDALAAGATAIVCERLPDERPGGVTFIRVNDTAAALGVVAANYHDHPTKKLKIIGVTGTNGKTSVVSLLYDLFSGTGHVSGMLSTIQNVIGGKASPTTHTTPDTIRLNALFAGMVAAGCEYAFMEVSSHAVAQKRIAGLHFTGGVFTNITHDHLDYHDSFRGYLLAKKAFFDGLGRGAFALVNADDKNGMVMVQNTVAAVSTFGLRSASDFAAKVLESTMEGMHLRVDGRDMWCKLVGRFNAYNLLAVYAVARLLGLEPEGVLTWLSRCTPPRGRFEHFTGRGNITVIVDYAHTPDALENVLKTIGDTRSGRETLITVVGCGGNRDAAKRPLMAAIAAAHSNRVILTSDNPRMEDPEKIIDDMKGGLDHAGIRKTIAITSRREAIHAAATLANDGDIILIAGKGHETYQEIKGVRYPFDDRQVAMESLQQQTR